MIYFSLYIFEQTGEVNSIFDIIQSVPLYTKGSIQKNKKSILKAFRKDREESIIGPSVPDKNPSKDISTVEFYYTPHMIKQKNYRPSNLPYRLSETIQVIDAFTCIGSRFGLKPLSVIVEVCQSNCGGNPIWANIYYVANSEVPASIIRVNNFSTFIDRENIVTED